MKILSYWCSILMLIGLMAMAQDSNSPPEVTNVVAQQVEISYDLLDRDGDLMTVSLQVSSDGGSNFDLETNSLTGEVGKGIASGQGKKIIWQVAVDIPDLYGTNFVFEVVADDNVGPTAGFVHPVDGASMALIPAGSFEMGDHLDGMLTLQDSKGRAVSSETVELTADQGTVKLAEPRLFSFAQMCDTQLGMGGYEHDVKTFGLAVTQINKMKPDFVVICGDLVSKANDKSWADFNRIKAGFKIPCHCAAGNHDVGNKPTVESLQAYREKIGKDYYTVEHKGYTFVIANTQLWKAPLKGESEKHDEWFKGVLAAAKKRASPVVVVVHYPLFVKTPDEKENYYNIPSAKRMELLKLCKENGVVAFLAGHTHKLVVNEYKGIQLVNGETTSKNFDNRPMGFRWWDVAAKGKMVHRFVVLEGMDE